MTLLLKLLLVINSYHSYQVINPKDGVKVVALRRLPGYYDDIQTEEKERLKVYLTADSTAYTEKEIIRL